MDGTGEVGRGEFGLTWVGHGVFLANWILLKRGGGVGNKQKKGGEGR